MPPFLLVTRHLASLPFSHAPYEQESHPRPLTAHRSLLTAHCSLLTAHRSLLTAHCSLLTAHRSPLNAEFPIGQQAANEEAHRQLARAVAHASAAIGSAASELGKISEIVSPNPKRAGSSPIDSLGGVNVDPLGGISGSCGIHYRSASPKGGVGAVEWPCPAHESEQQAAQLTASHQKMGAAFPPSPTQAAPLPPPPTQAAPVPPPPTQAAPVPPAAPPDIRVTQPALAPSITEGQKPPHAAPLPPYMVVYMESPLPPQVAPVPQIRLGLPQSPTRMEDLPPSLAAPGAFISTRRSPRPLSDTSAASVDDADDANPAEGVNDEVDSTTSPRATPAFSRLRVSGRAAAAEEAFRRRSQAARSFKLARPRESR